MARPSRPATAAREITTATARRLLAATVTILAALASTPGSIGARTRPDPNRGCDVLIDRAHPWHSHVPGGNTETGDHWITARNGPLSTCAFARLAIHRLLALPATTYQHRDFARLLGGTCGWIRRTGQETVRPFAQILCHLPAPRHPHTAVALRAIVDPDPALIH